VSLSEEFWSAKACWRGNRKLEPRDEVKVEGSEVLYLLWGNQIASWNQTSNHLTVSDCGWKTPLTFRRLNTILSKLNLSIYSSRGVGCIWDAKRNVEYLWKGVHTINIATNELTPNLLRKTNPKLAQSLRNYYKLALNTITKHKQLLTQTLDSTIGLFPKQYRNHQFKIPTLTLYLNGETLKAYTAEVASSKIYAAFMKNNATPTADYLTVRGEELYGSEILSAIDEFDVNLNTLPANIVQQLSLLKLVEV